MMKLKTHPAQPPSGSSVSKSTLTALLFIVRATEFETELFRGAWVDQLVEWLTLDFSSGQDLRVLRSSPAQWRVYLRLFLLLSPSFCPSIPHALSLSLSKINNSLKKYKRLICSHVSFLDPQSKGELIKDQRE